MSRRLIGILVTLLFSLSFVVAGGGGGGGGNDSSGQRYMDHVRRRFYTDTYFEVWGCSDPRARYTNAVAFVITDSHPGKSSYIDQNVRMYRNGFLDGRADLPAPVIVNAPSETNYITSVGRTQVTNQVNCFAVGDRLESYGYHKAISIYRTSVVHESYKKF
jgi:hypothetical protein